MGGVGGAETEIKRCGERQKDEGRDGERLKGVETGERGIWKETE